MKKLLAVAMLLLASVSTFAQFSPGQLVTAAALNNQFSLYVPIAGGTLTGPLTVPALNTAHAAITGGTIAGLSAPIPVASGGTGTTSSTGTGALVLATSPVLMAPSLGTPSAVTLTNGIGLPIATGVAGLGAGVAAALGTTPTGTGGVVLASAPSIASSLSITNGSDIITANNNANNVLVFTGTGTSTAKSIATTNIGGFIASSDTNVSDGVAFKSDFTNTAVFQGLNSSGTAGYDTNLTLYRPASTNNAFIGVTMSPTPGAEQHLWMGTDYTNNRYVFTQTVTGTGAYLPTTFRNGQADAFVIGTGTTPPITFYGGGVVLAGSEGNQVTWTLGGQTWSWNMASGGNFYVHDGTNNKFPLAITPNSTASLTIGAASSSFTGSVSSTGTGTMPLYGTTGTGVNAPHKVIGSVALSSGSATVTLSGSAVFTSSGSYVCTANDTTAANAVKVGQTSGTSITFTGTGTDTVQFACTGN
ncbi:hypothetical protein [Burkholderia cepacia]|uniref:hypothetical protein n=1 Tax=Burkholderia cepacia TaxID=292 RepID=UPI000AFFE8C6|nr:hypothetical protein [Burkholderia cepacia]